MQHALTEIDVQLGCKTVRVDALINLACTPWRLLLWWSKDRPFYDRHPGNTSCDDWMHIESCAIDAYKADLEKIDSELELQKQHEAAQSDDDRAWWQDLDDAVERGEYP